MISRSLQPAAETLVLPGAEPLVFHLPGQFQVDGLRDVEDIRVLQSPLPTPLTDPRAVEHYKFVPGPWIIVLQPLQQRDASPERGRRVVHDDSPRR